MDPWKVSVVSVLSEIQSMEASVGRVVAIALLLEERLVHVAHGESDPVASGPS